MLASLRHAASLNGARSRTYRASDSSIGGSSAPRSLPSALYDGRFAGDREMVRFLYRRVFGRDPKAQELDLGLSYLAKGKLQMAEYAQALLGTNEFIFLQ